MGDQNICRELRDMIEFVRVQNISRSMSRKHTEEEG